jgi:hypothetical protein
VSSLVKGLDRQALVRGLQSRDMLDNGEQNDKERVFDI